MGETMQTAGWRATLSRALGILVLLAGVLLGAKLCVASTPADHSVPSIFDAHSTPAESIRHLSHFVLTVTGLIFLVVASLLSYAVVKFRSRRAEAEREPARVYGSTQIELAWTVIPIFIVAVLFATTARVIHAIQDAPKPPTAVEVTVIGHQFWWETVVALHEDGPGRTSEVASRFRLTVKPLPRMLCDRSFFRCGKGPACLLSVENRTDRVIYGGGSFWARGCYTDQRDKRRESSSHDGADDIS